MKIAYLIQVHLMNGLPACSVQRNAEFYPMWVARLVPSACDQQRFCQHLAALSPGVVSQTFLPWAWPFLPGYLTALCMGLELPCHFQCQFLAGFAAEMQYLEIRSFLQHNLFSGISRAFVCDCSELCVFPYFCIAVSQTSFGARVLCQFVL